MQYFSIPYQVFLNGTLICEDVKAIQAMPASLSSGVQTVKMNIKREYQEKMQGKRVDVFVSPGAIEPINRTSYEQYADNYGAVSYNITLPQNRYQQLSKAL